MGGGILAVSSGFGRTQFGGRCPEVLQYQNVTILDNADCNLMYSGYHWNVTDGMICTFNRVGTGVCHGDSGGPLVANGKLIGVTSWSRMPCGSKYPDVFARISYYADWIFDNSKF